MKNSFIAVLMLCAFTSIAEPVRLGSLKPNAMIETNGVTAATVTNIVEAIGSGIEEESDPVAYPVATNALARLKQLEQYGDASIVPSPDSWFEFSGGTITGFNYEAGREHVIIPYAIGGIPVTSIGELAFVDMDEEDGKPIVSVTAPKTVTSVGNNAFYSCTALATVSLPLVTSVGDGAFLDCTALATVSLPLVTSVGIEAFLACSALTTVSLPLVTSVGNSAFNSCGELTSVSLPLVTSVGSDAFNSCSALTTVSLPSVTSVGDYDFFGCSVLTSITLGKNPPTWYAGTVATATIYVPFDASEDYGTEWNGMPVIRATESAANFYLGGKTLENRFGEKFDKAIPDIATNLSYNIVVSNGHWLIKEVQ